jgi:hypothetical protein
LNAVTCSSRLDGADLGRGTHTGLAGSVYVEPGDNPGAYDREILLVLKEFAPNFSRDGDRRWMRSFRAPHSGRKPTARVIKDVVTLGGFQQAEIEFVANNPGPAVPSPPAVADGFRVDGAVQLRLTSSQPVRRLQPVGGRRSGRVAGQQSASLIRRCILGAHSHI